MPSHLPADICTAALPSCLRFQFIGLSQHACKIAQNPEIQDGLFGTNGCLWWSVCCQSKPSDRRWIIFTQL